MNNNYVIGMGATNTKVTQRKACKSVKILK